MAIAAQKSGQVTKSNYSSFQFLEFETFTFTHGDHSEPSFRKTKLREDPYFATYYVFWSKVIFMELIPYLFISVLNGCIMAKIYSSYKFRRQFLRRNNEQQVAKGLQRISPNSPRNNGGMILLHHDVYYFLQYKLFVCLIICYVSLELGKEQEEVTTTTYKKK